MSAFGHSPSIRSRPPVRVRIPWRRAARGLGLALAGTGAVAPVAADVAVGEGERLRLSGDFRLRAEADRDSTQPDGIEREDRDRLRIRLRFGFTFALDGHVRFGARVRTGNPQDQQSPHQTLGDEFETKEIHVDRAWVKAAWKHVWTWGGKNAFPFWTQNELFWDEDVNPEGVAVGGDIPLGGTRQSLRPVAGYFILENSASSNEYGDKARLAAAQVAWEAATGPADVVVAAGLYRFRDGEATTDTALDDLDYDIRVVSGRAVLKEVPGTLAVGLDWMRNATDDAPDLFNGHQETGYVAGLLWAASRRGTTGWSAGTTPTSRSSPWSPGWRRTTGCAGGRPPTRDRATSRGTRSGWPGRSGRRGT